MTKHNEKLAKQRDKRASKKKTKSSRPARPSSLPNMVEWADIKTPETLEEARDNLRRYYLCNPNSSQDEVWLKVGGRMRGFPISEFYGFHSFYEWNRKVGQNQDTPWITPTTTANVHDLTEEECFEVITNVKGRCCGAYLSNPDRVSTFDTYSIEDQTKYIECLTPTWSSLDNQVIRRFYQKTLGKWSGYNADLSWTDNANQDFLVSVLNGEEQKPVVLNRLGEV